MFEILSALATNALYDLFKGGFHKIYENVKLVLQPYNIDDETIKLVHYAIKNLDHNAILSKDNFQDYLANYKFPTTKVEVSNSPNSIVVTNSKDIKITIKQAPKNKKEEYIFEGTISSNHAEKAYIKYLIDRYHEFKKSQEKEKMNYTIIYSSIKRQFKIKWGDIPSTKFEELSTFLQKRINMTIIGKQNKLKGYSSFKTFDEFCGEHL